MPTIEKLKAWAEVHSMHCLSLRADSIRWGCPSEDCVCDVPLKQKLVAFVEADERHVLRVALRNPKEVQEQARKAKYQARKALEDF